MYIVPSSWTIDPEAFAAAHGKLGINIIRYIWNTGHSFFGTSRKHDGPILFLIHNTYSFHSVLLPSCFLHCTWMCATKSTLSLLWVSITTIKPRQCYTARKGRKSCTVNVKERVKYIGKSERMYVHRLEPQIQEKAVLAFRKGAYCEQGCY